MRRDIRGTVAYGAVAISLLCTPIQAFAQDDDEDPVVAEDEVGPAVRAQGEIVVTGSRLSSTTFNAPTPLSVIGSEDLQRTGSTNVIDAINELPAFRASADQMTVGVTNSRIGQFYLDLRGLGTNRTLTLIDGKRVVSSATTGEVDVNLIPSNMVERVEAVTGGASAAYGSDAVAGVANIILVKRMDGIKGTVQYGISERGDAKEFRVALAGGTSFGDGRGSIVVGGEYVDSGKVGDIYTRDWGREEWGFANNPDPGVNGPARILAPNLHYAAMNYGGIVQSGPLKGTTFLGDGQTGMFDYSELNYGTSQIGGDGYGLSSYTDFWLRKPFERYSLLARAEYEFSPAFVLSASLSHSKADAVSQLPSNRDTRPLTIRQDNAFLPESVRQDMIDLGLDTLRVGRYEVDLYWPRTFTTSKTWRGVLAAEGELGGNWGWDAYYSHGESEYNQTSKRRRLNANWTRAYDAVVDPDTGDIVCRSTLTDPTNGCVPIDIFGLNEPGEQQAAIDYVTGTSVYVQKQYQDVGAVNLRGEPFSTWAGPVAMAIGAEIRKEKIDAVSDPLSQARQFSTGNYQALKGDQTVKEAYGEIGVPLLADAPLAYSLDLNAAGRWTDYSLSGVVYTWKLGATYQPVEDLMFRITRSRDIRAPNLSELFNEAVQGNRLLRNPYTGQDPLTNVFTTGNRNLTPEIADTLTAGVTVNPSFLPGLRFSADYFRIEIEDQITTLGPQTLIDRCFEGATEFCQFVEYNADNSLILSVTDAIVNAESYLLEGADFELAYNTPLWGDARLGLRALATYTDKSIQTDSAGALNIAGQNGRDGNPGIASWTGTFIADYQNEGFRLASTLRYISSGKIDKRKVGPDDPDYDPTSSDSVSFNTVPAFVYVTLSASQAIELGGDRKVELFGVVNNLFDKDPAIMPNGLSMTNPAYYDVIGRRFTVGFRFEM